MQEFIPEIISGAGGFILGNLIWLINYTKNDEVNEEESLTDKSKVGGAGKRWTDYDTRFLIEHSDLSNQAIAEALNRTEEAIKAKKNSLDIKNKQTVQETQSIPEVKLSGNKIDKIMEQLDLSKLRPDAILEPEEVVKIYLSDNPDHAEVGNKFGVTRKTPKRIKIKRDWKWLTDQVDRILDQETQQIAEENYNIEDILNHIDLSQLIDARHRKLDPEEVIRIYLSDEDKETLAEIFDVTESAISGVTNKNSWSWLTDQIDGILNHPNKRIDLEPSQRNRSFFD